MMNKKYNFQVNIGQSIKERLDLKKYKENQRIFFEEI